MTAMAATAPGPPALASLPRAQLARLLAAGEEALECRRVLRRAGLNLVGEVLRGQREFVEYEHYPREDVFDDLSHAQYYYHAHRGGAGEHGHFHTFLRAAGMPPGLVPVSNTAAEPWPAGEAALAHLIAVSMDPWGEPLGLFAVNRWVTGDTWYRAADLIAMLDGFVIDHAWPSWPLNRWITALLRCYRPEIEVLLRHRDASLADWAAARGGEVLEDRALEITGWLPVAVEERVVQLRRCLGR